MWVGQRKAPYLGEKPCFPPPPAVLSTCLLDPHGSGVCSSAWPLPPLLSPQLPPWAPEFVLVALLSSVTLTEMERSHLPCLGEPISQHCLLIPPLCWGPHSCSLNADVFLLPPHPSLLCQNLLKHRSDFVTSRLRGSQWLLVDRGIANSATWQLLSLPQQGGRQLALSPFPALFSPRLLLALWRQVWLITLGAQ